MLYYLGTQERATKYRGVEQLVARRAHNPEVAGSNPVPATKKSDRPKRDGFFYYGAYKPRRSLMIEMQKPTICLFLLKMVGQKPTILLFHVRNVGSKSTFYPQKQK